MFLQPKFLTSTHNRKIISSEFQKSLFSDSIGIFALGGEVVQNVPELIPAGLRDQNRISEVPLHFRDGHVTALKRRKGFYAKHETNPKGLRVNEPYGLQLNSLTN